MYELAEYCRIKGAKVKHLNIGGAHTYSGFTVKYTPAFHSSSIQEGDYWIYLGQPAGILLNLEGKTLFHAGDTALFGDMRLIGERNAIDIAALPIGDMLTMGPDDALLAARAGCGPPRSFRCITTRFRLSSRTERSSATG